MSKQKKVSLLLPSTLKLACVSLIFSLVSVPKSHAQKTPNTNTDQRGAQTLQTLSGTVNIILANKQGLVAVTQ